MALHLEDVKKDSAAHLSDGVCVLTVQEVQIIGRHGDQSYRHNTPHPRTIMCRRLTKVLNRSLWEQLSRILH